MFEESDADREQRIAKAVAFAGGYVPRNPEVLAHLHREFVERALSPSASHAELAYANGQRALVMALVRQYRLATQGSMDPWQTITTAVPSSTPQPPAARPQRRRSRKAT